MKGAQGLIKGLAIAFAVFLVVGIGAAVFGMGVLVGRILDGSTGGDGEWSEAIIGDRGDFEELSIEVGATNVRIERGDGFQILADEEVIEFRRVGDKIYLEEKDRGWFGSWDKIGGELKVILPRDMRSLRKVEIDAGAGTVYAEGIFADEVKIELGAGRAEFVGLVSKSRVKISGGAGHLVIREAELMNLDLDMGVGKVEISGKIRGKGDVDAGVGKLEMALKGGQDDYRMRFNKGLGSITVNGENMRDEGVWGNGVNAIEVDGGVGAIEIRVEEG